MASIFCMRGLVLKRRESRLWTVGLWKGTHRVPVVGDICCYES
jgi:hypothetical protein